VKQADIGKLGKYDIEGELGKGAMGVVYKGKDPFIERFVALKTVRADMLRAEDPEATSAQITRFKREARAAGRLNHPNIVGIYEYGEDDGTAFIAMEFIEGRDLKDYFDKEERFEVKTIVRIMGDVLSALDYAHHHGIVHRDIKPANIMLTDDGVVKITDFGIARLESSNLTQVGAVMGTPSYMSPEQFMGQQVDGRSDIFSSGAVLYQLLTGEKPFTGSLTTVMHRVLHSQPERPSALNVQIPRAFDQVVEKAMAKRPEDRYQSAAEFAQALRDAAERRLSAAAVADGAAIDDGTTLMPGRLSEDSPLSAPALSQEETVQRPPVMMPAGELSVRGGPGRGPDWNGYSGESRGERRRGRRGLVAVVGAALVAGGIGGWLAMSPHHGGPGPDKGVVRAASGDQGPPTPTSPVAEAKHLAEEKAQAEQAAADAARLAEARARAEQAAAEAKRQAEAQARAEQAALEAQHLAEAQARAEQAAIEAKRQADERVRAQQAAMTEAVLGSIRTVVNRAPCSLLRADPGTDGTIMVTGAMGEGNSEAQLRALIGGSVTGAAYTVKTETVSPILCDSLDMISSLRERNQGLSQPVQLQPINAGAVYKDRQNLILDLHGPSFPAYLQVDYFTLEGYVVHLWPNGLEKEHKLGAGGQRKLGDPAGGGRFWTVGQPFGRELVVAIASAKPLFPALRPEAEQATGYLTELRKALSGAEGSPGALPVATALFITTVPN
jgi:serine/threonine-protein kinase